MGVPTLTAAIKPSIEWGLLYWDGSRLQVDTDMSDGVGAEANSYANVVFAKFGSVVGFFVRPTYGAAWATSLVKFNPISPGSGLAYASIPAWNVASSVILAYNDRYMSSSAYHNATNVQAGRGDICMLAGRTPTEARTDIDNKTWRLPTNSENITFIGDPAEAKMTSGSPAIITFDTGYSLPALGYVSHEGAPAGTSYAWGTHGQYWSSSPADEGAGAFSLEFIYLSSTEFSLRPTELDTYHWGFPTRCVRQTP